MNNIDINKCKPLREGRYSVFRSVEKGCSHIGNNTRHCKVRQFKVDGSVIISAAYQKCDYLILNDDERTAYYIELKGSDISRAAKQIDNTVDILHSSIADYTIYVRIVYHTGSKSMKNSDLIKWKKKYKGRAIIKERLISEAI